MEVNYNYNNGTILKFLRKVLNEINQTYVDSGMRTAFLLKRYIEKYKTDSELGPQHVLLCMMKDIGLFYMNGEVPDDDPAKAAASSFTFLKHCSPLGEAARPLLFYKAKYIETQANDDYDLGLLMTLLNDVVLCIYEAYSVEEIEDFLKQGKENGLYKPEQVRKTIKLLRDDEDILSKLTSESNLYVFETQKYISTAGYNDEQLEKFIDTTSFAFEFHNHETLAHTITTAEIAEALAIKCKLTKETAAVIKIAARVHDIGKIRVPREVLCFPGRLEGEMLEEMQRHVVYTKEIIEGSFSYKIVDIAANHHEKLDGSGYPNGLTARDLSSGDKVIAVADICSALYCRRSYKAAFDDEKIKDILLGDAKNGKIDQRIVNHLIDNFDEIMAIAKAEEEKVLEKYNAMKAEYEALIKSPALKHFFDIPEEEEIEEETPTEEVVEEVNADAQVTEEFLEGISSTEEEEYDVPEGTFDEEDLYSEESNEFDEFLDSIPEKEEPIEELPAQEEPEEEPISEEDEFASFIDSMEEEPSETNEFDEFLDSIPEKEDPLEETPVLEESEEGFVEETPAIEEPEEESIEEIPALEEESTFVEQEVASSYSDEELIYKVQTITTEGEEHAEMFYTYSDALYYATKCWASGYGDYKLVSIKENREIIYMRNDDIRPELWDTPDDIEDFAYDNAIEYEQAALVLTGKISLDDAQEGLDYHVERSQATMSNLIQPTNEYSDYLNNIPEPKELEAETNDQEEKVEAEVDEFSAFLDSIPDVPEVLTEEPKEELDEFSSFIQDIPNGIDDEILDESNEDNALESDFVEKEDESDSDEEELDDEDDEEDEDDLDDEEDDEDEDDLDDEDDAEELDDEENIDDEIYDDEEWAKYVQEKNKK